MGIFAQRERAGLLSLRGWAPEPATVERGDPSILAPTRDGEEGAEEDALSARKASKDWICAVVW